MGAGTGAGGGGLCPGGFGKLICTALRWRSEKSSGNGGEKEGIHCLKYVRYGEIYKNCAKCLITHCLNRIASGIMIHCLNETLSGIMIQVWETRFIQYHARMIFVPPPHELNKLEIFK